MKKSFVGRLGALCFVVLAFVGVAIFSINSSHNKGPVNIAGGSSEVSVTLPESPPISVVVNGPTPEMVTQQLLQQVDTETVNVDQPAQDTQLAVVASNDANQPPVEAVKAAPVVAKPSVASKVFSVDQIVIGAVIFGVGVDVQLNTCAKKDAQGRCLSGATKDKGGYSSKNNGYHGDEDCSADPDELLNRRCVYIVDKYNICSIKLAWSNQGKKIGSKVKRQKCQ